MGDVIVVGAGPTGLMLAGELCLAGVRPIVLERQPRPRELPKANGMTGQVVPMLDYRGLLERMSEDRAVPASARFPFGGLYPDFGRVPEDRPPMLPIPQPRLERILAERAEERGAEIRRGHRLLALDQDDDTVRAQVRGPDGDHTLDRRLPGGLRRRGQPGARRGRHRLPRGDVSRGDPDRPRRAARQRDAGGRS